MEGVVSDDVMRERPQESGVELTASREDFTSGGAKPRAEPSASREGWGIAEEDGEIEEEGRAKSPVEPKVSREDLAAIGNPGTKPPVKIGRPRSVDRVAILKKVCRAISKGDSVQEACRENGIRAARLHEWTREDSVLASIYARAREQQAHSLAERAIAVSREAFGRDTAGVQAARLEVDTLKWYVSKIAPKLYGERLLIEDEGEKVIRVVFEEAVPPGRQIADGEWEAVDG